MKLLTEYRVTVLKVFAEYAIIVAIVAAVLYASIPLMGGFAAHPADLCPGGRTLSFDPPRDITAYEVALVLKYAPRSPICVDDAHPLPAEVRRLYQP